MAPPNGKNGITTKGLLAIASSFLAVLAGIAIVHARLLMPAVLAEATKIVDDEIERHSSRPHPSSVGREELTRVIQGIEKLATKESVDGLRRDIERLEEKIER